MTQRGWNQDLLEVQNLTITLPIDGVLTEVVRGVDLSLARGEVLGIVGESGSGKSLTARALMRLTPAGAQLGGAVLFKGNDVLTLDKAGLRAVRSGGIAMVYQDPRASINPVVSCGAQVREILRVGRGFRSARAQAEVVRLLELVSIRDPERVGRAFPMELSGGMLQRVLIAMALASDPELIIADEATTSLDVTVQAEILAILADLRREHGLGMLFITHDLELAAVICDRIAVMYGGRIVEHQDAPGLFENPRHPYTVQLLAARPHVSHRQARLAAIPGRPPALAALPTGCPFHPRCGKATELCVTAQPPVVMLEPGAYSRCHYAAAPAQPYAAIDRADL
jgi:oligopeptide/dipeptide ABC transporter ATP-binding protein